MKDQALRQVGLKVTAPRVKILQILKHANQRHLKAEAIYQQLKVEGSDVGLATIYRVLGQFERAGLVIRHNFDGDHAVFELNEGPHHDHLVCIHCGGVEEFVDATIEQRQQQIAKQADFKMTHHCLNIYGICNNCQ